MMSDSEMLADDPPPVQNSNIERTPRQNLELSNADQISLLNSSIESALKRQSDNFMQYLDSRIAKISKPTQFTSEDSIFTKEGNQIQFRFNSERSSKLAEVLDCIFAKNLEGAEDIIRSEIEQFVQRNKLIKIADRHGWDVVKEYILVKKEMLH